MSSARRRVVVVGRNSVVWSRLRERRAAEAAEVLAISHGEVASTAIGPGDRVWIFSYSRNTADNRALLSALGQKGAATYHYLSTATTNVVEVTRCYSYPRAKADAEQDARDLLSAEIVRVGVVYGEEGELPSGAVAATSLDEIAAAMFEDRPAMPRGELNLFRIVDRPFRSTLERVLHRFYGTLLAAVGSVPCLLRPLDLLLRAAGMRWYGYLYLSNRLWLCSRATRHEG